MVDPIIQQARICDGTGNPSVVGMLGVTDRRITYLGRETGLAARRTMSADGLVVAPGVYRSAHARRRPDRLGSAAHQFLLARGDHRGHGQLRRGVAPVKPAMRDILLYDLVNVGALPDEVMQAGIDWQWERDGNYLAAMDRRGLGINVAALVPLKGSGHFHVKIYAKPLSMVFQ